MQYPSCRPLSVVDVFPRTTRRPARYGRTAVVITCASSFNVRPLHAHTSCRRQRPLHSHTNCPLPSLACQSATQLQPQVAGHRRLLAEPGHVHRRVRQEQRWVLVLVQVAVAQVAPRRQVVRRHGHRVGGSQSLVVTEPYTATERGLIQHEYATTRGTATRSSGRENKRETKCSFGRCILSWTVRECAAKQQRCTLS